MVLYWQWRLTEGSVRAGAVKARARVTELAKLETQSGLSEAEPGVQGL